MEEEEVKKHQRPIEIVKKARIEYDRVFAERISLDSSGYRRAAKAALRAYDKVLREYDRKQRKNSSTS